MYWKNRFEGQATVKVYAKEFDALHRLNDVITNFQGWIRTNATLVIEIDTNGLGRRKFHAIRHCPSVDVIEINLTFAMLASTIPNS